MRLDVGLVVEEVLGYIERHEGERRGWVPWIDEIESAISINMQRSTRYLRLCDDETDDIAKEEDPALVGNQDIYERDRYEFCHSSEGKEKEVATCNNVSDPRKEKCSLNQWIASRKPAVRVRASINSYICVNQIATS